MDIERQENFTALEKIPGAPLFRDDSGKICLNLLMELPMIRDAIDGAISLGARKGDRNTVCLTVAVQKGGMPAFLREISLDTVEYAEMAADFLNEERQYISFFYELDGNSYYGLSKAFRLEEKHKAEMLAMFEKDYPIIHKIRLSQADITSISEGDMFKFVFSKGDDLSMPITESLKEDLKLGRESVFWLGMEGETPFVVTDRRDFQGIKGAPLCDPLEAGAIPYGAVSGGIMYIIVTDREGFEKLVNTGNRTLYEKNYSFWD